MNGISRLSRLIAALSLFTIVVMHGKASATCPPEGNTAAVDPNHCEYGTWDDVSQKTMVCTLSGVRNGGYKVVIRNASNQPMSGVEVWLYRDDMKTYLDQGECLATVCMGEAYPENASLLTAYGYVEGHTDASGTVRFNQRWGGSGSFAIYAVHWDSNQQPVITSIAGDTPMLSTDMNGDGKWDQSDLDMFDACEVNCAPQADFDLSTGVDSADRAILEADVANAGSTDFTTCGEAWRISNLDVDWVSSSHVGLLWTAPGPQTGWSKAGSYDIRYSTSPITDANFNGAASVTTNSTHTCGSSETFTVGSPAGTLQSNTTYYFAIKATNGNGSFASNISNVLSVTTTPGGGYSLQPAVSESPTRLDFTVVSSASMRGTSTLRYSIPPALSGTTCSLAVFDAGGRCVRSWMMGLAQSGVHELEWDASTNDGSKVGPGVYFARLSIGTTSLSRPVVMLSQH
jgi:hypothetical protein